MELWSELQFPYLKELGTREYVYVLAARAGGIYGSLLSLQAALQGKSGHTFLCKKDS